MYANKRYFEEGLLTILDVICILVSMVSASLLRYGKEAGQYNLAFYIGVCIFSYFVVRVLVPARRLFSLRGYFMEMVRVLQIQLFMYLVMTAFLYVSHQGSDMSRLMSGFFYIINAVLSYLCRLLLKKYLFEYYKKSSRSRKLLVVTDSGQADEVLGNIRTDRTWDISPVGIVIVDRNMTGSRFQGYDVVCRMDELIDYVKEHIVDEVFIKVDSHIPVSMKKLVASLKNMGVIVNLHIQAFDIDIPAEKRLGQVGPYPVVAFGNKLLDYTSLALKRLLDIAGGLVGMVILGIATIFVAPAIKLESPGPVFFSQTRVGKNGRLFKIYKFRSMYQDAEARKQALMAQNEMQGLMFKMENDPRITKVGHFIRRTSIDELPQFWNILKGDMSLVGTRPPTEDEYEQYKPEYKSRLSLMPGLTGLWQVSGRSKITDFDEVVALDLKYIENWSLMNDIKILFQTVGIVLTGRGAK